MTETKINRERERDRNRIASKQTLTEADTDGKRWLWRNGRRA